MSGSGAILDASAAALELYGYSDVEMRLLNVRDLRAPTDLEPVAAQLVESLRAEDGHTIETEHIRQDGTRMPVEVRNVKVSKDGQTALFSTIRDLSADTAAKSDLLEAHQRLQFVMDASHAGVLEWDLRTDMLTASEEMARQLGYAREEWVSVPYARLLEHLHPDDVAIAEQAIGLHLDGKTPDFEFEARFTHRDGHWVWLAIRGAVISRDSEGTPTEVIATSVDVGKRKEIDGALRESEALFRSMMTASPDDIAITDMDGHVITFSDAGLQMFALTSADQAIGRSIIEFIHPDDRERAMAGIGRVLADGRAFIDEYRGVRADGGIIDIEASGAVITGSDGAATGLVFVVRDITERKHVDERVRAAETRYRVLFDEAPDGITVTDENGFYVDANASACALFGYTREEMVGEHVSRMVTDEQSQLALPALEEIKRGSYSAEWQFRRKDGTSFSGELHAAPLAEGMLVGIVRDISDKAEARRMLLDSEARLREANESLNGRVEARTAELSRTVEELKQANEAKTRFLRSMSHELRTPLNSIIGFSSMMKDGMAGPVSDEQALQLNMINTSGKHLLELINDMLDLSRIDAGMVSVRIQPVDLRALLAELTESLAPTAEARGLALELDMPKDLPVVESDATRVKQILLNLVGNALKFTTAGGVGLHAFQPRPDQIAVSVSDTGPGIDRAEQQRVFGEFERGALVNVSIEGTGLGLAVSRGLADRLGGKLTLVSEVGEGATFTLVLPVAWQGSN